MRARWGALRTRTKVLIAVVAVILFGMMIPSGDEEPVEAAASIGGDTKQEVVEDPELPQDAPPAEPEEATVPQVVTQQLDQARARLQRADLAVQVIKKPSWKPVGTVLEQGTRAGKVVALGAAVTLVVAALMPSVPGVIGQSSKTALASLRRAGFTVRTVQQVVTSGANGVVLRQTPAATNRAAPGSVVEIAISNVVRPVAPAAPAPSNCTSGYSPCLPPASDYDCEGGSGDGPRYTGCVRVTGSDPYGLDTDGDGAACES